MRRGTDRDRTCLSTTRAGSKSLNLPPERFQHRVQTKPQDRTKLFNWELSYPNGNLSQTLSGKRKEFLRHTCEPVLCTCSSLMVQCHQSVKSLHGTLGLLFIKHRKRQVPSEFCLVSRNLAVADRFSLGASPLEHQTEMPTKISRQSDCHTGHLGCERAHIAPNTTQIPRKFFTGSETRPTKKTPQQP